eukprot:m.54926 g.54926  ORF g.54926 m.54926 type:complete len:60 (-) comp12492_c0_seq2:320-499(-)
MARFASHCPLLPSAPEKLVLLRPQRQETISCTSVVLRVFFAALVGVHKPNDEAAAVQLD